MLACYIDRACGQIDSRDAVHQRWQVKRLIKRLFGRDRTATTGDGTQDSTMTARHSGIAGEARDLDGDGVADFIEPPTAIVYWVQELLPAVVLLM